MSSSRETTTKRLARIANRQEMGDPQDWRSLSRRSVEDISKHLKTTPEQLARFERGVEDLASTNRWIARAYRCPTWAIREWRAACFGVLEQEQRRAA